MKKLFFLLIITLFANSSSKACNAFFTHTYACAGDTIFFSALDQFGVYTWDFGDTVSGVANVSHDTDSYHVYNTPGTYYVTLFVNIGAEWDYKSQIIHVDTVCFNASFTYGCTDTTAFTFINESTGNNITSFWNFGDTASGANDTSTATNPSHGFSNSGVYLVTLITSDGINSDTSTQYIYVDGSCLSATFYNFLSGDCFQNVTTIPVGYTGSPVSYHWNFGDPASGVADTSSDSLGVHQFSAIGTYLITLIIADTLQTDTFYSVQNIIDCTVWPGNTNTDGEVNMEDLFAIGINFGDSGTVRSNATTNWTSQPCPDWTLVSFNYMYLQDLVDKKHADCNGDGVVNIVDVTSINQNYGFHPANYHQNDLIQMMPVTANDPVLKVNTPAMWSSSFNVSIPIDLSATDSVRNVYGVAARIYLDMSAILQGSVNVTLTNGWMGTPGINIIGLTKEYYADGYVDFGIVRTDRHSVTGNGTIAYLNFTLNNFTGQMNFDIDPVVRLISNGLGNQEVFRPVSAMNTQMTITTLVNEITNDNISVYPNPVRNLLTVVSKNNVAVRSVQLMDITGWIVREENFNGVNRVSMNCEGVVAGIYLVVVGSDVGRVVERVEVR